MLKHKMLGAIAALALVTGIGVAFTAPAKASVNVALCNLATPSLCANRNGGGTGPGTKVIVWKRDFDNNEDFTWIPLSDMCSDGEVSTSPACPFTVGGGLNAQFNHDEIVKVLSTTTGLCIATASAGNAVLGECPGSTGADGADGTIMVKTSNGYFVNRYWSDNALGGNGTMPAYMCGFESGQSIQLDYLAQQGGNCQWAEVSP